MARNNSGSKREVRPGVWQVRVSAGYSHDGRQRRVSRTVHGSEREADAAISALVEEMGKSSTIGDPMTLDEYFWDFFIPSRETTSTHKNVVSHRSNYRAHISEWFGSRDIGSITNRDVQRWVDGLPPQSAPNYVRTLRAVLNQAAFDHFIDRSPMDGYRFRMPRGRNTAPLPVWGPREVADALSRGSFRESRLFALWCVMAGAGLSRSEGLALDWESLDWHDGEDGTFCTIRIDAAWTEEDGLKEPKNSRRYRAVPLPPAFAVPMRSVASSGPICQSVHNGRETGRRISASYVPKIWRSLFRDGAPLDGLPFVTLGRMRATYSTMMQAAGVSESVINAMQGRSENSAVLYSNYLNPLSETFLSASRAMQDGFGA